MAIAIVLLGSSMIAAATQAGVGQWRVSKSVSKLDDSQTVSVSLGAEKAISGWPGRTATPKLIFRCREGDVDAYVAAGLQSHVEASGGTTAWIRIDEQPPFRVSLGESTTGEGSFFRYPANVALELEGRSRMLFRFTPFKSSPQETSFDVRGIEKALLPVMAACDWNPKALMAEALDSWRAGLGSTSVRKRVEVAREIGRAGAPGAPLVPDLVRLLDDVDLDVRVAAATALGDLGLVASAAVPDLRRAAADPVRKIRVVAEEAIERIESAGYDVAR
jgi:hypothetical protein